MLINTVILFIRDLLPCFTLLSVLLVLCPVQEKNIYKGTAMGLFMSTLMYFNVSWLSQLSEGFGLELIEALMLIGFSLLVTSKISTLTPKGWLPYVLGGMMILLMIPNTLNFAIYATAYWPSQDQNMALLLGIVLGLGISSSLACLIYLILKTSVSSNTLRIVLVVFSAGQVAEAANLFEQIDWLPSSPDLWDSAWLVSDQSEYGHLLRVFFGYEANPSVYYLLFFCIAAILPFAAKFAIRKWRF